MSDSIIGELMNLQRSWEQNLNHEVRTSTAAIHSLAYDVLEASDGADSASTETALVVARPMLLQRVTETVPAIDLDNRHRLMQAILEMMRGSDTLDFDATNPTIQPHSHAIAPVVTVLNLPVIADAQGLRNLFLPRRLSTQQELFTNEV